MPVPSGVRLQKLISRAGVASRRAAEAMIERGRVAVDGKVVTVPGARVDPDSAVVTVDGEAISWDAPRRYLLANKPPGYVSTVSDTHGRPTVLSLVSGEARGLFPVGRLDLETEGLLVLTDDGDLANLLMHPRHHVPKTYEATVEGVPTTPDLERLAAGIHLDDGATLPAQIRDCREVAGGSTVTITVFEGRKRQVRRMFDAIGHPVSRLVRVGFGPLDQGGLDVGQVRVLEAEEVEALRGAARTGR